MTSSRRATACVTPERARRVSARPSTQVPSAFRREQNRSHGFKGWHSALAAKVVHHGHGRHRCSEDGHPHHTDQRTGGRHRRAAERSRARSKQGAAEACDEQSTEKYPHPAERKPHGQTTPSCNGFKPTNALWATPPSRSRQDHIVGRFSNTTRPFRSPWRTQGVFCPMN